MGHIRLKHLPATRKWDGVVALLAGVADSADVARASAEAAEHALQTARDDPAVGHSPWLLTQIALAARAPDFSKAARAINVPSGMVCQPAGGRGGTEQRGR